MELQGGQLVIPPIGGPLIGRPGAQATLEPTGEVHKQHSNPEYELAYRRISHFGDGRKVVGTTGRARLPIPGPSHNGLVGATGRAKLPIPGPSHQGIATTDQARSEDRRIAKGTQI